MRALYRRDCRRALPPRTSLKLRRPRPLPRAVMLLSTGLRLLSPFYRHDVALPGAHNWSAFRQERPAARRAKHLALVAAALLHPDPIGLSYIGMRYASFDKF